jgi:predicted component of type VI protein secretion system
VEARQRLNELALKINSSDKLEELLQDVVQNTDALKQIAAANPDAPAGPEGKK